MAKIKTNSSTDGHKILLQSERFEQMASEFRSWRMSTFIRQLEKSRKKGKILPFVRGLRLSAHLIYATRELLEGTNMTANWGHLLDNDGNFCSPECDVIIHKNGHIRQWNDTGKPVMDFRFVSMNNALVVISCKSRVRSIDEEYPREMNVYVGRIWLFGECCGPRSGKSLAKKAEKAGYEKFWYLYTWSPKTEATFNRGGWSNFVDEVQKLKDSV